MIFNEMWHDYSISSMPVHEGKDKRTTNENNFPFYEAMKTKFGTLPIYCPEPQELAQKLRAMAQWDYSWKTSGDTVEMQLDLSGLKRADTLESLGGMGVSIENTRKFIQSVLIDGRAHPAFSDRRLILPNLAPGTHTITIKLGASPASAPHLTYVSKLMTSAKPAPTGLVFNVKAKAKARFAVAALEPAIALHADWQEWDSGSDQIKGFVNSDREVEVVKVSVPGFHLTRASLPILTLKQGQGILALRVAAPRSDAAQFRLRAAQALRRATLAGKQIGIRNIDGTYELGLPTFSEESELILYFK